jgi:hypothetical protein
VLVGVIEGVKNGVIVTVGVGVGVRNSQTYSKSITIQSSGIVGVTETVGVIVGVILGVKVIVGVGVCVTKSQYI